MIPGNPEETNNSAETPEAEIPENVEAPEDLRKALDEARKKAEEYLASWQRTQADFINYKRRTEQEREEFNRFANANLCCAILPVVDDLERAIEAIPEEFSGNDWVEGVRLVERKFKTILEGQGVKAICALNEPFDPNLHEALRQEKGKEGIVIGEYQKGYTLHDKLLRPAMVVVGTGDKESKEESKEEE
jgi:molecular chaperone GrpE